MDCGFREARYTFVARDERIRMRNGLVIPGVLLVFYGVLAIVYAEAFRARSDFCADSNRILIAGLCYSVRNLILPLVVVGLALIFTGLFVFRSRPDTLEGYLHHGTPTHVTLALLVSWVAVTATTLVVQLARQANGPVFELTVLGARYEHAFLLQLLLLVGVMMLVPYLALYFSVARRRREFVLRAEQELDEDDAPAATLFDYEDTAKAADAQAVDMVPDDEWPEARDKPPVAVAAVVSCLAKVDGRSCSRTVRAGARFCSEHGCQGVTKDGTPCRNQGIVEGRCQIHVLAEHQA